MSPPPAHSVRPRRTGRTRPGQAGRGVAIALLAAGILGSGVAAPPGAHAGHRSDPVIDGSPYPDACSQLTSQTKRQIGIYNAIHDEDGLQDQVKSRGSFARVRVIPMHQGQDPPQNDMVRSLFLAQDPRNVIEIGWKWQVFPQHHLADFPNRDVEAPNAFVRVSIDNKVAAFDRLNGVPAWVPNNAGFGQLARGSWHGLRIKGGHGGDPHTFRLTRNGELLWTFTNSYMTKGKAITGSEAYASCLTLASHFKDLKSLECEGSGQELDCEWRGWGALKKKSAHDRSEWWALVKNDLRKSYKVVHCGPEPRDKHCDDREVWAQPSQQDLAGLMLDSEETQDPDLWDAELTCEELDTCPDEPPPWTSWASLGAGMRGGPAGAAWAPYGFVYARGSDDGLWSAWQDGAGNGTWSSFSSLFAGPAQVVNGQIVQQGMTSDPAAVAWGPGRMDVFARGPDNALWHKWFDGAWVPTDNWERLGAPGDVPVVNVTPPLVGGFKGSPAASSHGPGLLDVFVRGIDDALWQKSLDPLTGWGPWISLGGQLTSDPAAVSWDADRTDVFVAGVDHGLWQKTWVAGGWTDWIPLDGNLDSGPDVASWGPGRLDVVARGTDAALYRKSFTGLTWTGWEKLGMDLTSGSELAAADPAVVSRTPGVVDVFAVRLSDGTVIQKTCPGCVDPDSDDKMDESPRSTHCADGPGCTTLQTHQLVSLSPSGGVQHTWQRMPLGSWSDWDNLSSPIQGVSGELAAGLNEDGHA